MYKKWKSSYKKGERKVNTWCRWNDRLDPYGCGCQHDCSYCYAKSLLAFRGLWHPENPSAGDLKNIEAEIRKLPKHKAVRIGGMTDPFQPLELTYRITLKTLELLRMYRVPYLIVTKSDMICRPEYLGVLDLDLSHIQITVTSTDDALARTYEPKAPASSRRIAAIEKLQELGYDVQLRLSPFIPEFVDIDRINAIKCDKVLIEFLKVSPWIQKWFNIDYSPYTLKCGGYLHLPLERKIELANLITGFKERSVGEFVPEHHDYFSKNYNHNPKDCCNLRR